ncbi:MAG: hypothetical protein KAW17_02900 [Candidatus Eisenbacteria sp.]|nr:hypothetical protein [Candidatus Eisenbacteria bacterium]
MKRTALFLALAAVLIPTCGPNDNPPTSASVIAIPDDNAGAIGVYLVLSDVAGTMTTADGAATVRITESRSDPYAESGTAETELFRGQFPVLKSRFRKMKSGKEGAQSWIAFPVGRIAYSEFYEKPTRASGTVTIKFRPRYCEKDLVGETAVRFK